VFDDSVYEYSLMDHCDGSACRSVPIEVDGEELWKCLHCGYTWSDNLKLEMEEGYNE